MIRVHVFSKGQEVRDVPVAELSEVRAEPRTLGAYAAIFAVVTMISGVYGMNFQHMPELAWRYGYSWALGLMVVTASGLWVYFKRKGWL